MAFDKVEKLPGVQVIILLGLGGQMLSQRSAPQFLSGFPEQSRLR